MPPATKVGGCIQTWWKLLHTTNTAPCLLDQFPLLRCFHGIRKSVFSLSTHSKPGMSPASRCVSSHGRSSMRCSDTGTSGCSSALASLIFELHTHRVTENITLILNHYHLPLFVWVWLNFQKCLPPRSFLLNTEWLILKATLTQFWVLQNSWSFFLVKQNCFDQWIELRAISPDIAVLLPFNEDIKIAWAKRRFIFWYGGAQAFIYLWWR